MVSLWSRRIERTVASNLFLVVATAGEIESTRP